ncbi:uncharacterized protein LOC119956575 isoform X2 [Scyliorhinus canicula]|uniref:uncharacterized protein LOC119956575 isoform X2 n=1 Tax=Scyliorhinus canicula TaxID=7830 RepID=UPI0018F34439|nr:uncharacterized protein LOC119956575 isoform X2 [Scyliorhinus canicula]
MKFRHVHQDSLKERGAVKNLIVAFFFVIFLSGSCRACNFGGFEPYSSSYGWKIDNLITHLPTDYNITVFLQDSASLDGCCVELQEMLALNRSIGHLYHHSVNPLQTVTSDVLAELRFLMDCPIRESSNCEMVRYSSSHLLRSLKERFRSLDAKFNECNFSQCTLSSCRTGRIEITLPTVTNATTPSMEPGIFANGTDNPTTSSIPTTPGNTTNPTPTSTHGDPTDTTNPPSPLFANGSLLGLTDRTSATPDLAGSRLADGNLTRPPPSLINVSLMDLTNGSNAVPVLANGSRATAANRTEVNTASLEKGGIMAATLTCNTEPSPVVAPLATQMVVIILVVSVLINMFLVGCLLKRNRRLNK